MSLYFVLYLFVCFNLGYIGTYYYIKGKKTLESYYFLLCIYFLILWLILYFLFYLNLFTSEILLIFSRCMHVLAVGFLYSKVFYLYFYEKKQKSMVIFFLSVLFLLTFFFFGIFSSSLVLTLGYNEVQNIYYEHYGTLYLLYMILCLLSVPLIIYLLYIRLQAVSYIKKVRLKIVGISFLLSILIGLFFLTVLPYFGIRLYEKQLIIAFFPYIFGVWYVNVRYKFFNINYLVGYFLNIVISLLLSTGIVFIGKTLYLTYGDFFTDTSTQFVSNQFIDLLLGLGIFLMFFHFFREFGLGGKKYIELLKKLSQAKKKISYISDILTLNRYLSKELSMQLGVKNIFINLNGEKSPELKKFFDPQKQMSFFMNDTVFIEENKNKFHEEKILQEILPESHLVFPIRNKKSEFIGVLEVGYKTFKDYFTKEEIELFEDLCNFLSGHLKYIEIYQKINELNINLDKKVDEKTIAYNQLLNRQNDFIAMASHEIKSPLGSCIFQVDCLLDDLEDGEISKEEIHEELKLLSQQLIRVGNLTKNIFSAQKYDLDKISLYKQENNVYELLDEKLDIYKKVHPQIEFIFDLSPEMTYVQIDRIQFEQVIDNLLTNAIKFAAKSHPKILVKSYFLHNLFVFEIEDNGAGFKGEQEIENLFNKYTTGTSTHIGLGMGLYLCKKIINMHDGEIFAKNGEILGGGRFEFFIPINSIDDVRNI